MLMRNSCIIASKMLERNDLNNKEKLEIARSSIQCAILFFLICKNKNPSPRVIYNTLLQVEPSFNYFFSDITKTIKPSNVFAVQKISVNPKAVDAILHVLTGSFSNENHVRQYIKKCFYIYLYKQNGLQVFDNINITKEQALCSAVIKEYLNHPRVTNRVKNSNNKCK